MEPEGNEIVTRRVLILEGDLDGNATGEQIEITPPQGPVEHFSPGGLSYEPATDLFFFTGQYGGTENRALWAVDRNGELAPGYPALLDAYPVSLLGRPDVHGGPEGGPIVDGVPTPGAEGVRAEMGLIPNGEINFDPRRRLRPLLALPRGGARDARTRRALRGERGRHPGQPAP